MRIFLFLPYIVVILSHVIPRRVAARSLIAVAKDEESGSGPYFLAALDPVSGRPYNNSLWVNVSTRAAGVLPGACAVYSNNASLVATLVSVSSIGWALPTVDMTTGTMVGNPWRYGPTFIPSNLQLLEMPANEKHSPTDASILLDSYNMTATRHEIYTVDTVTGDRTLLRLLDTSLKIRSGTSAFRSKTSSPEGQQLFLVANSDDLESDSVLVVVDVQGGGDGNDDHANVDDENTNGVAVVPLDVYPTAIAWDGATSSLLAVVGTRPTCLVPLNYTAEEAHSAAPPHSRAALESSGLFRAGEGAIACVEEAYGAYGSAPVVVDDDTRTLYGALLTTQSP